MKKYTKYAFLLVIGSLSVLILNAASIKGHIEDSNSHELIVGAVVVEDTNQKIHAITDANGDFVLQGLAAGKYLLDIRCLGYEELIRQTVVVKKADEVITPRFSLKPKDMLINEVLIQGNSKTTDVSARNAERVSESIINVMSAKTIELSPDLTVANVVQRVSGVTMERNSSGDGQYALLRGMDKRFNYTMVNGIKIPSPDNKNRFVPLDIFPSELLDRLEVTKTLTADMEGDGIGGAVNMVMKDAPEVRQFSVNLSTGYNSLFFDKKYQYFDAGAIGSKSPNEKYGLTYPVQMKDFSTKNLRLKESAALPNIVGGISFGNRYLNNRFGFIVAASYQNSYKGNTSDVYSTTNQTDGKQSITKRDFSNHQNRLGLHAKFDYNFSENHKLVWYNAYMNFGNDQVRYATGYNSETVRMRTNNQSIINSTLKGTDRLAGENLVLNWSLSYGKAMNETPDNVQINAFVINGLTSIDQNTGATRKWEHNSDRDLSGYASLLYKIMLNKKSSVELSSGGMYRDKARESFYNEYTFKPYDTSKTNPRELIKGVDWNNFDEIKFTVSPFGNLSDPLNYSATEKIGAGYFQAKLTSEKNQFGGGLRAEYTNQGYSLKFTTEGARNDGNQKYVDLLPSLSFKHQLCENANLRLSYAKAINRPSFFEIVPYSMIYEEYKERGNPDLKHTTADNFDARYEYFPHPLEQVLVGLFYKQLKNPIEFGMMNGFGQDTYYMPMNFGDAKNYGVELDVIKYIDWLGIKANYTYTRSAITTTKMNVIENPDPTSETHILTEYVDQTRPLFGQAAHVANLSLMVKTENGWNAQLAFSYTSDRLCIVSRYLDEDSWQAGNTQMDISLEKKLKSGLTLFAKASNLLNTPMIQYIKENDKNKSYVGLERYKGGIVERKETYGLNMMIGIRYKIQ